jgi:hypothetical protein
LYFGGIIGAFLGYYDNTLPICKTGKYLVFTGGLYRYIFENKYPSWGSHAQFLCTGDEIFVLVTAYATYNRPLLPGRLFVAFLCGADWQGPAVAANSCKETTREWFLKHFSTNN